MSNITPPITKSTLQMKPTIGIKGLNISASLPFGSKSAGQTSRFGSAAQNMSKLKQRRITTTIPSGAPKSAVTEGRFIVT